MKIENNIIEKINNISNDLLIKENKVDKDIIEKAEKIEKNETITKDEDDKEENIERINKEEILDKNIPVSNDYFQPYVPVVISTELNELYKLIPFRTKIWDYITSWKTQYTIKYLNSPELIDFVVPIIKFEEEDNEGEEEEYDEENKGEEEEDDEYLNIPNEDIGTIRMNALLSLLEPFFSDAIKFFDLSINLSTYSLCINGLLKTFNYYKQILDMSDDEVYYFLL